MTPSQKMLIEQFRERERVLREQIIALQNELKGVQWSIAQTTGEPDHTTQRQMPLLRRRARNVNETVLRLVTAAGPKGLSAVDLVERAQAEGVTLNRGTVSSLLSRLKREGTLAYNGTEYAVIQKMSVVSSK
jgi:CRP-like cAMP-binding protein